MKLEIISMEVKDIKQYEFNAKLHPQEQINQLKKSIEQFGFNDPIAVDENNTIIEGHGRLEAMKQLMYKNIPVIKLEHLSEQQKKAYILAHNKINMNSGFDQDLLEKELIAITDIDMGDLGFDMSYDDIDDVINSIDDNFIELEEEVVKNNYAAPLPFQGQKRNSSKMFQKLLLENFDDSYIFVDLFGGSGLLSRIAKDTFPNADVYYNDFDGYHKRLENIELTNEILEVVHNYLRGKYCKNDKLSNNDKQNVLEIFKKYDEEHDYIDWRTLGQQVLFSGQTATTLKELCEEGIFYNKIRTKLFDVNHCKNWCNDINVTKLDWLENITNWKSKDISKVLFIADPPYLGTNVDSYSESQDWDVNTFLEINWQLKGTNNFFFTSDKSNLIQFDEFIKRMGVSFFSENKIVHTNVVAVGSASKYNDYMILNFMEKDND